MLNGISHRLQPSRGTVNFIWAQLYAVVNTAGTTYYQALIERAQRRIANPAHAMLFVSLLQERSQLFNGLVAGTLCHDDDPKALTSQSCRCSIEHMYEIERFSVSRHG